jgi:ribosomal protein S18 acetylase RimI-like enzyme
MPVIKLTVRRGNLPAIRLYEKMGYSQIDIWSKYYRNGEDGLVFTKLMDEADGLE